LHRRWWARSLVSQLAAVADCEGTPESTTVRTTEQLRWAADRAGVPGQARGEGGKAKRGRVAWRAHRSEGRGGDPDGHARVR
jgi:hypothetical protein